MKEDIVKFRKCVDILKKEKKYTGNQIVKESGLTWPTYQKLIKEPIETIKIQASILGIVQDFLHKHCNDLNYAGIKAAPESVTEKDAERIKNNLRNYKPEYDKIKWDETTKHSMGDIVILPKLEDTISSDEQNEKELVSIDVVDNFMKSLSKVAKQIPSNVKIQISIN